jgi:hypothetical protein
VRSERILREGRASITDGEGIDFAPEHAYLFNGSDPERMTIDVRGEVCLSDRQRERTAPEADRAGRTLGRVVVVVGNCTCRKQHICGKQDETFHSDCCHHDGAAITS